MMLRLGLPRLILACLAGLLLIQCTSGEPRKRERVPPPVADSTMPWNRPTKWEGAGRYGQMMQGSR